MAGTIDLEKVGDYPIVLSDSLMMRGTKDVYTRIRYNHKPDASDDADDAKLRPLDKRDKNYELSFSEGQNEYKYEGSRQSMDDQYVLVFNAEKQHFVLHQIDSSFDMNLTQIPGDDPASYEQLGGKPGPKPRRKSAAAVKIAAEDKRRKVEKPKKKPPPREPTPEVEDEDSDDGLLIEYPDGPPPSRYQNHSTPVHRTRELSVESDADADADFEEDEDEERNGDVDALKLPSPVGGNDANEDEDADGDDDDLDLEAELEKALEKEMEPTSRGDESSESEEE